MPVVSPVAWYVLFWLVVAVVFLGVVRWWLVEPVLALLRQILERVK
jgi:hypothetical protein